MIYTIFYLLGRYIVFLPNSLYRKWPSQMSQAIVYIVFVETRET